MHAWSIQSNLKFNATKCKVLTITRKQNPVIYNYHLGPAVFSRVNEEKDLGVTISSKLTWHHHISDIVAKANGYPSETDTVLNTCQVTVMLCYPSLVPGTGYAYC